jgi:hypothetical protein
LTSSIIQYCHDARLRKAQPSIHEFLEGTKSLSWALSGLDEPEVVSLIDRSHRATAFICLQRIGMPYVGLQMEWFSEDNKRIMALFCSREIGCLSVLFVDK